MLHAHGLCRENSRFRFEGFCYLILLVDEDETLDQYDVKLSLEEVEQIKAGIDPWELKEADEGEEGDTDGEEGSER